MYKTAFQQKQRNSKRTLSVKEELVMTLLRCRRGLDMQVLGNMFAVSSSTVSRIFTTWVTFLRHHLLFGAVAFEGASSYELTEMF